jgi:DNA-binding MarR family transcriptional regulator
MSSKNEVEELFIRRKPVRLLLNVKIGQGPKYVSILAKDTDCTYSHTVKLLDIFKTMGIVDFEKHGRIKYVKLTQDGQELASDFEAVMRKFAKLRPKKK